MALVFYTDSPHLRSIHALGLEGLAIVPAIWAGARIEVAFGRVVSTAVVLAVVLAWPVYVVFSIHVLGGTLAQRLFGVRVIAEDGSLPTLTQSAVRFSWSIAESLLLLTTGPVGMALLFWSRRPDGRWWHDRRAGTRLVWARDVGSIEAR